MVEGLTYTEISSEANCGLPGNYTFYHEARCEECGGDDLQEVDRCPICGEWTAEDYCEDCMEQDILRTARLLPWGER